jgi:hypothetical protein
MPQKGTTKPFNNLPVVWNISQTPNLKKQCTVEKLTAHIKNITNLRKIIALLQAETRHNIEDGSRINSSNTISKTKFYKG